MKQKHKIFSSTLSLLLGLVSLQLQAKPTVSIDTPTPLNIVNDSPGFSFVDENGKYYYHDTLSQYSTYNPNNEEHAWRFFTGDDFYDVNRKYATQKQAISDRATVQNTVPLCENSPLMQTIQPRGNASYPYNNFCGLMSVWVDPDTGDWYGLVHDEIFGLIPRQDAIELAKSTDKGKNWHITKTLATSQFGMRDSRQLPAEQPRDYDPYAHTYDYGGGDPRLFVDYSTGYFYVFYTSRVLNLVPSIEKDNGFDSFMQEHVMRAPISEKMAPNSWAKYYQGQWLKMDNGADLSLGNIKPDSNIVPTELSTTGYYSTEYTPKNAGVVRSMRANGQLVNSPLRVMNVSWNAYLNKYIATPEHRSGPLDKQPSPLPIYATDNLSSQKWTLLATLQGYSTSSWYRFMMDSKFPALNDFITGKNFTSNCYHHCSKTSSESLPITLNDPTNSVHGYNLPYLRNGNNEYLYWNNVHKALEITNSEQTANSNRWVIHDSGDGYVRLINIEEGFLFDPSTPRYLSVAPTSKANIDAYRKWGTKVDLTTDVCSQDKDSKDCVASQWIILKDKSVQQDNSETETGHVRFINRLSGLALSFNDDRSLSEKIAISPPRNWNCVENTCLDSRTTLSQQIDFK
ncbi:RICIN domain-containing protein [Vibrio artabrorum]|uniref:RICIN domain-containing protein n=1 Tax=Vibrio artabrorum TaxID=446374 RepID=A0ABT8CP64_9VIBR|nr:RICIN domain-containing protein [Vibrio artabrorum]MDN3702239.1 RICIN domain-containing protein [Vibrio artabrorum]